MAFIDLAHKRGIDMGRAHIVEIINEGNKTFGMVRARVPRRRSGDAYWYQHVVLDYNGVVFDFDFTEGPLVLERGDYAQAMFYAEERPDYVTRLTTVQEYLRLRQGQRPDPGATSTTGLVQYTCAGALAGPSPP
jgi:hypothetical protein